MNVSRIGRKYPLATFVVAYLLIDASSAFVVGRGLGEQVMSTAITAAVSIIMLYLLVPRALDGFPVEGAAHFKTPEDRQCLKLASDIVLAGMVAFVATSLFIGFSPDYLAAAMFTPDDAQNVADASSFAAFSLELLPSRLLLLILLCLLTGLFEEGLFRGLAVPLAFERSQREIEKPTSAAAGSPFVSAAIFSSLLFALLHVTGFGAAVASDAASSSASGLPPIAVVGAQAVLKMLQTGLFGFCMAVLFIRTRSIWLPAVTHAVFDLFYLGPLLVASGQVPATYLTGSYGDIAVLVLTSVMLLPPTVKSARWLMHEVVPYSSFHE